VSPRIENRLLLGLSDGALAALGALESVGLTVGEVLETAGQPIPFVYFPQSGLAAVVAQDPGAKPIDVGMIGMRA
jgi:hypothetical protein